MRLFVLFTPRRLNKLTWGGSRRKVHILLVEDAETFVAEEDAVVQECERFHALQMVVIRK